jgi:macrolide-specific efflux system membrane fusion protein
MKYKFWIIFVLILILGGGGWRIYQSKRAKSSAVVYREVRPAYGTAREIITAIGTVEPQNRLAIIPPISGRIDQIYVQEGTEVRAGQQLAIMSSTDRAALLDAASAQGQNKVNYWAEVYKPTPILAPISGRVIVRSIEPGQTVNSGTTLLVLADVLIVKAQIDETDIGKVAVGQKTTIALDAYPEVKIAGVVKRISYESKVINNVTIYEVEIAPDNVPAIFRSGMSANIEIIRSQKDRALLIPERAIVYAGDSATVLIKTPSGQRTAEIKTGIVQDGNVEVLSGLSAEDIILAADRSGGQTGAAAGGSPFMPARPRGR